MEENVVCVEVTDDGTLLETIEITDVKDPFVWSTLVREWIGDGYYRSVGTHGAPDRITAADLTGVGEG